MSTAGAAFHVTTTHRDKDHARARLDQAITNAGQPLSCELDPEAWFPGPGSTLEGHAAIAFCQRCPVLDECRTWAHTKPIEKDSVVLGGEWWANGHVTNPRPKRNRKRQEAAA